MNAPVFLPKRGQKRQLGRIHAPTVTLAHGGGGKAMKDLIDDVFISAFAGGAGRSGPH